VLEFGEYLLDRVEVGGQEEKLGSYGTNELTYGFASVATEIVHDHDVARTKRREKDLLDVEAEAVAVDWALDKSWRLDGVMAQGRQEGPGLPAAVWNFGGKLLAAGCPSP
jgi:hypothetical protein